LFCVGCALPDGNASTDDCNKKPRKRGVSLFQPPRLIAEGVNVDPLGSCMIGASVFPDKFRGLVAMGRALSTVTPLEERGTEYPKFMAPSADANVVGSAKAIASAIVASFMTCSFSFENENIESLFARSIKISVSAIDAAKLPMYRRPDKIEFSGAAGSCIYIRFMRIDDQPLR
jgi:hypothetical protein